MRVFVIGPQGSGKTTFFAMLSRYVASSSECGVTLIPDATTKSYILRMLTTLEKGQAMEGTRQGREGCRKLSWTLSWQSDQKHLLEMTDAAGQDLEDILLHRQNLLTTVQADGREAPGALNAHQSELMSAIDAADVLVYMMDLDGYAQTADGRQSTLLAETLQSLFVQTQWKSIPRLILMTKADLYAEQLPHDLWGDSDAVRQFLKARVNCPYYSFDPRVLAPDQRDVTYAAVASFESETVIIDGEPEQRPRLPLRSRGMEHAVKALCLAVQRSKERRQEELRRQERKKLKKEDSGKGDDGWVGLLMIVGWMVAAVLLMSWF